MARDHLGTARDDNLVHIASDQNLLVTVGRRYRVVVVPVAYQRQRVDAARSLLAGIVGSRRRLLERSKVAFQSLTDRAVMTAQPVGQTLAALLLQMRVQRLEVGEHRDRHHEVPTRIADEPLHLTLVVALAGTAEPVGEQVVRLQLAEHARALTLAVAKDARHRDLGVVVEDRLRYAAEELEGSDMAVTERFRRLGRIASHEDRVRVRQIHRQKMDLAFHAADHAECLAEVDLGMPRRMHQRHEHLLAPLAPTRYVILHDRDLAREPVLVAQPFENALGRMPLLLRPLLVGG